MKTTPRAMVAAAALALPMVGAASHAEAATAPACVKTYVTRTTAYPGGPPETYIQIVNGCSSDQRLRPVWSVTSGQVAGPCTYFKAYQSITFSQVWADAGSPPVRVC